LIRFITPATKYLKVVIPAKVLRQAQDRELAERPESRRALDAGSVIPDRIRDRHDGVGLVNRRINRKSGKIDLDFKSS
jgi:hypothetical protein